ncbi:MAG: DUF2974 domain-containing protein [Bifidobacterium sp.]|nr:DUF2974 domain-containing protein [Bifidobacterium sp.]
MGTILDYARDETRDFTEYPFRAADAMVFALLSYERIPNSVPRLADLMRKYRTLGDRLRSFDPRHPLSSLKALARPPFVGPTMRQIEEELAEYEKEHPHSVQAVGFAHPELDHQFYRSIARNPRFAVVRVSAAEDRLDPDRQTQFAVETYQLTDGTLVIAFRGTDDSLVGWQEDFNMTFQYPVPAQRLAADYLEDVAGLWDGDIILTGHSKGGNLAVYAAMNAPDDVKDRIAHVYSFDGPGFTPDVVHSYEYGTVVDRITKFVPDGSIIGMLLTDSPAEHRMVVKSSADGIGQHSCYTWQMDGDRFELADDLQESSKTFNQAINTWLSGMTQRQREHAVEALFRVLSANGTESITELMAAGPRAIPTLLGEYVGLTGEERKYINQALWMLATATWGSHH